MRQQQRDSEGPSEERAEKEGRLRKTSKESSQKEIKTCKRYHKRIPAEIQQQRGKATEKNVMVF
jgi:hypothetical protein